MIISWRIPSDINLKNKNKQMKKQYIIFRLAGLLLLSINFYSCAPDGENGPLDIINQKVDLETQYYKNKFVNPVKISGTITAKATSGPLEGVTVTAKLYGSNTEYSTLSKTGGLYNLYVEGKHDYIVCATKTGYDSKYIIDSYSSTSVDTIITISSDRDNDFVLNVQDLTPVFKINYISSLSLTYSLDDIAYNGTLLAGVYGSTIREYTSDGSFKRSFSSINYVDFISSQDTFYWVKEYSSKLISKLGQKGGKLLGSVTCQISSTSNTDMEILNNNIWIATTGGLYKLSMAGDQANYIDLGLLISDLKIISITKSNGYLYILNKEVQNDNLHKGYSIYKFDPATSTIVSKGYMPVFLNSYTLGGIATDGTNFWVLSGTSSLVKLLITE
jgi:hypothetical protein